MNGKQVHFEVLDISAQLRMVMASERLTVTQLADAAGVSKSAMEKYLAGPSSPRATSIAALCTNLGLSPEWLLFGYTDSDWRRVRDFAFKGMVELLHELKRDPALSARFGALEVASSDFLGFAFEVSTERAEAVADKVLEARKKAMLDYAEGVREVRGETVPMPDNVAR